MDGSEQSALPVYVVVDEVDESESFDADVGSPSYGVSNLECFQILQIPPKLFLLFLNFQNQIKIEISK